MPTCVLVPPLCNPAQNQYSLTLNLKNNPYVSTSTHQLTLEFTLDGVSITSKSTNLLPAYTPQTLTGVTASRSVVEANQATTLTLSLTSVTLTAFTLIIDPDSHSTPLLYNPTNALYNSQVVTHSQNTSNHLTLSLSGFSKVMPITIDGTNPFFVSKDTPNYAFFI